MKNNMPKVSVLMSSYNHEKFIAFAIKSVLEQSFSDFELLIMDDNSNDKTFEIASEFAKSDARIKLSKSPYNRGMVQNTNELINQAKGEYIAIINSDDFWVLDKLEKQVNFLDENSEYGACFSLANLVDEKNKILNIKNPFKHNEYNRFQWLNHFLYNGNSLCYPSSLVRKSCYEKVGGFNPAFICLLDLDMWIRICVAGYEIKILQEPLTNFRILDNEGNLSSANNSTIIRLSLENQRLFYNYLKVQDYQEFIKIFPEYEAKNQNHQTVFYLTDLIICSFFSSNKIPNAKNIQNFGLVFLQEKISNDPNFIKTLEKDFDFSFKKYLQITSLYPNGICFAKAKAKWYKNILKFFKS